MKSPSLAGYPDADGEVQSLAADVWGDLDGVSRNRHFYGKGRVVWGLPLADVLASMQRRQGLRIQPGVGCRYALDSSPGGRCRHLLRGQPDGSSRKTFEARFRVGGKEAELWHPDTGAIEPAEYAIADGPHHGAAASGGARVGVRGLPAGGSLAARAHCPARRRQSLATVNGPWDVSFLPNLGAPAKIQLAKLESWTANSDEGVKYFSGTATYTKAVQAPETWFRPGAKSCSTWDGERSRRGFAQRQAAGHVVETALPAGRYRRA